MTAPTPYLTYYFGHRMTPNDADRIVGDTALYNVHRVHASLDTHDNLRVGVDGVRLKKDGTRSQRNGHSSVNLTADQPRWLEDIIADARTRLEA